MTTPRKKAGAPTGSPRARKKHTPPHASKAARRSSSSQKSLTLGTVRGRTQAEVQADVGVRKAARHLLGAGGQAMVFTGAGVSAESGIPTYRDPGGIWERYDQKAVGHIHGFVASPQLCWRFEFDLWKLLKHVRPNAAHHSIAELERAGVVAGVITQNVDGLHQAAGCQVVHELHGNEMRGICLRKTCRKTMDAVDVFKLLGWVDDSLDILDHNVPEPPAPKPKPRRRAGKVTTTTGSDTDSDSDNVSVASTSSAATSLSSSPSSASTDSSSVDYQAHLDHPDRKIAREKAPRCPHCSGVLKPDAIYFGEELKREVKKSCFDLSKTSQTCLVVGSSCIVSPANKLPLLVRANGGCIVEVNPKKTLMTPHTAIHLRGAAGEFVPQLLTTTLSLLAAEAAALAVLCVVAPATCHGDAVGGSKTPSALAPRKKKKVITKVVKRKSTSPAAAKLRVSSLQVQEGKTTKLVKKVVRKSVSSTSVPAASTLSRSKQGSSSRV